MLRDGVPVQSRVAKYDFVASYYGYFLSAFDFLPFTVVPLVLFFVLQDEVAFR